MVDKLGGQQKPTLADLQRNLDAIINRDQQHARKELEATKASLAARGLSVSGPMLQAALDVLDEHHKKSIISAMNFIHQFSDTGADISMQDLVATAGERYEKFATNLLCWLPPVGKPQLVDGYREQYAAVFRQRLEDALRDIEIGFIDGHRLSPCSNAKGDKVLDHMLEDRVTLVKKTGRVERENIPSLVTKGQIQIHDTSFPIEIDDHLLRVLPNGLVEDYVVHDPVLHSGLGQKFYTVHVRRSSTLAAQQTATVQQITNNFHGANSRVNISSTDNSINLSGELNIEELKRFIEQVRPALSGLSVVQQQEIVEPLNILETEAQSEAPSKTRIHSALNSIKTTAEGAAGNLIATGIVGLINLLVAGAGS